jgi:hypothetical protein
MKYILHILLLVGACLHVGCNKPNTETTILVFTSDSAPNETITMRLETQPDQAGSLQFGIGQPIGWQKTTVTPTIKYSGGLRFVDIAIRREESEESLTFPVLPNTQSSHKLPYGISLKIK